MTDRELLPCPFCGDEHFSTVDMTYMHADGPTKGKRIKCVTCGAQAPDTAWNLRARLSEPEDVVTVPREPTIDMVIAGEKCEWPWRDIYEKLDSLDCQTAAREIYHAMLDAAQKG